jgi:hypothetical protein
MTNNAVLLSARLLVCSAPATVVPPPLGHFFAEEKPEREAKARAMIYQAR